MNYFWFRFSRKTFFSPFGIPVTAIPLRAMSSQIGNGPPTDGGDDDNDDPEKAKKSAAKIETMNLKDFKVEDYEEKYKNDPRYIPTPKCPSCGGPGERFVSNVNSRFHSCPSCKIVYMTQTMEEQKRKEFGLWPTP